MLVVVVVVVVVVAVAVAVVGAGVDEEVAARIVVAEVGDKKLVDIVEASLVVELTTIGLAGLMPMKEISAQYNFGQLHGSPLEKASKGLAHLEAWRALFSIGPHLGGILHRISVSSELVFMLIVLRSSTSRVSSSGVLRKTHLHFCSQASSVHSVLTLYASVLFSMIHRSSRNGSTASGSSVLLSEGCVGVVAVSVG